jgi:hypothetical protein
MTEDEKMQVAVFRFGVISDFVIGSQMSRAEKRRLMRDKCARKWQIPFSEKTRLTLKPSGSCNVGVYAKHLAYSRFHPGIGNAKKFLIIPSILSIKKLKLGSIQYERKHDFHQPS